LLLHQQRLRKQGSTTYMVPYFHFTLPRAIVKRSTLWITAPSNIRPDNTFPVCQVTGIVIPSLPHQPQLLNFLIRERAVVNAHVVENTGEVMVSVIRIANNGIFTIREERTAFCDAVI
jgi:hypothetical protein